MTMSRASTFLCSFFTLAAVAGVSFSTPAHATDDPPAIVPCTAKSFKHAKVKKACEEGGRTAAKKVMKEAVKKARAAGEVMNCKTCHSSLKTFELTEGASKRLGKWL